MRYAQGGGLTDAERGKREQLRLQAVERFETRVEGTWQLLKRHGWSWQQPARRAIERDDDAVEVWRKETWPRVRAPRRNAAPGSSLRTKPGSR